MQRSPADVWSHLADRFGPRCDLSDAYALVPRSDSYWLVSRALADRDEDVLDTRGFRFVRARAHELKPTTDALQFLGDRVDRNRIVLAPGETKTLLEDGTVDRPDASRGFVALAWRGRVVGCGHVEHGDVTSRVSKARARELVEILDADP